MNIDFYLQEFQLAQAKIDKSRSNDPDIRIFTGIALNCVVIKAYKPEWSNDLVHPLTAACRIFFSVWVSKKTIEEGKIYYNIHAFKLRHLPGHKIASRDFAERFRRQLKPKTGLWPNCNINYGPLTLMEGWIMLRPAALQDDVAGLVQNFYTLSPLIESTLSYYKK